jgi:hypothetical protein
MIGAAVSAPGPALRAYRRRTSAIPARASNDATRSAHGGRRSDSEATFAAAGCVTVLTAGSTLVSSSRARGCEVGAAGTEAGRKTLEPARVARLVLERRARSLLDGDSGSVARATAGLTRRARGERALSPTAAEAVGVAPTRFGAGPTDRACGAAAPAAGASAEVTAAPGEGGWTTGSGAGAGEAAGAGVAWRGGSSVSGST